MKPCTQEICPRGTASETPRSTRSPSEQRVVVTKDGDFVDSFLLRHEPYKLLLVATGNITNNELERLFQQNLEQIVRGFEQYDFIELGRTALICHL